MDDTLPDPNAPDFVGQVIRWAMENGTAFAVGSLLLLGLLLLLSFGDRHGADEEPGSRDDKRAGGGPT